jgi:hypothetical protein
MLTSHHGKAQFALGNERFFTQCDAAQKVYFICDGKGFRFSWIWCVGNAIVGKPSHFAR